MSRLDDATEAFQQSMGFAANLFFVVDDQDARPFQKAAVPLMRLGIAGIQRRQILTHLMNRSFDASGIPQNAPKPIHQDFLPLDSLFLQCMDGIQEDALLGDRVY
jgi:hypothetical protein